jgi:serine/threonine protein kinase
MEVYDTGEIWDGEGDDLAYEYTKVVLKKGDAFYHARTFRRLGSSINVDELKPIPIPTQEILPPYSTDLTRAPTPLPVDCYVKYASLLDCGSDLPVGRRPADLVLAEAKICEILRTVPHPNIAHYIGCLTQGGRISALCFTKYESTLADLLQDETRLGPEIYDGIRSGIQHLHRLGFSHNDINPYNIMFKSDVAPVIIDFDSCVRIGEKLGKAGGWEDEIYEFASQGNDYSSLKKIEEIIHHKNGNQDQE